MDDIKSLKNEKSLNSYRAWKKKGLLQSGYTFAIVICLIPMPVFLLAKDFVFPMLKTLPHFTILSIGIVYIGAVFGAIILVKLKLDAWKRANPWTPTP